MNELDKVLDGFHPAVASWFRRSFASPTEVQAQAWPAIQQGQNVLIAAPTGSGKTLAAFLATLDGLVKRGLAEGLTEATTIVYVSPLKALSNDIQRNLEVPLAGIRAALSTLNLSDADIRTVVRSGDTPQAVRTRMLRHPPHIVVTTPESLYILLTSASGRAMLASTRTVIVDEIHALAPNKRGTHLALSLERLEALTGTKLQRIGLSATQKPIEEVARFLVGNKGGTDLDDCTIIDAGHARPRDLAIEVPATPLEAVLSGDGWQQVYDRIAALVNEHRTTLIFVNTRRMAERTARHLSERLGEQHVTAHHGSMAKEHRLRAEQRLKNGELKALVATASLELGIDIGEVDLVCQIGSPRRISTFLQRVGRSGHAVNGVPKGRLFALSRDELIESAALLDAVQRGELDKLTLQHQPLDVLAQQIVAEVSGQEWGEDELFDLVRRAYAYRDLTRAEFDTLIAMLAAGYNTRRGRRNAYLHHDAVNHRLRGRKGARLTAITCGGTIPDNADYTVVLEPEDHVIGTLHEDFAVESMAGDIFQLGNASYRILRVETGRVRVEDAQGQPPTMPFWLGEAPARSDELSFAVARLRETFAEYLSSGGRDVALDWLVKLPGLGVAAAQQIADYLAAAHAALGLLPTQSCIVFERFFDEAGGTQLVIHAPFGSRINRAWGLALRKRFCRKFNFELQAAALDDSIIFSLTSVHSFPLEEVAHYLHSSTMRGILVQALLDAPMFATRWRWNASTALALTRFQGGRKVPPQIQRMNAEDLIAATFPDQLACAENLAGEREIPDHPLVQQTIGDCLHEAMDSEGLENLLRQLESGEARVVGCDLTEPSPLAQEILTAKPYAFLDDAPLEERRTQAVMSRRWLDPESAADIGKLDPEAIARVCEEAWPDAETADELHDALLWLGFFTAAEVRDQPGWAALLETLAGERRAARLTCSSHADPITLWVVAERLPEFMAVLSDTGLEPAISCPAHLTNKPWTRETALVEILRGRLEGLGPVTATALGQPLALSPAQIEATLMVLQGEGFVMSGRFSVATPELEWCERRLLARIHRYTVKRLRQEIEPVPARDFMRFLFDWQHAAPAQRMEGPDALARVISQLEGFEAAAASWETEILPARVNAYEPGWLDDLCLAGRVVWIRLPLPSVTAKTRSGAGPIRSTPIVLLNRRDARYWTALVDAPAPTPMSSRASIIAATLGSFGAAFFDELVSHSGLLRTQVEDALAELVALGLVNGDSFSGLRALLTPASKRASRSSTKRRHRTLFRIEDAGRWALVRREPVSKSMQDQGVAPSFPAPFPMPSGALAPEALEHIARTLLRRYGVVFWRLLAREADWLPPWRELLRVYRRLEARGEIRGGRFVAGFSGEQFALTEAVGLMREVRRRERSGALISVSGADPLNLVGIIVPGTRLPAIVGNRVLYRDGVPLAVLASGETSLLETPDPGTEWKIKNALLRRQSSPNPSSSQVHS